jgi:hypothetical protein
MRQRSASYQQDDSLNYPSAPSATNFSSSLPRVRARKISPRLSLPQRATIVEATRAEDFSEDFAEEPPPQPTRQSQRLPKPAAQALVAHSAKTAPLDLSEPLSPADLQIIPRTAPAIPSTSIRQNWFHKSSPRITIIKLSLIAIVTFSVLVATFATAGGGGVISLFQALGSVIPYSAPAQTGTTTVAQRVHPIIQADNNAGYDSQAQHDIWWDSACSAAAMTEILHAWGIMDVRIGQLIDVMYAHNPPYITPSGGLMTPDAWPYMMNSFHMQAAVHFNRSMSYDDIVRMTENQGIPVVIGVRDSQGLYYPALAAGHFLVAVGGSAAGLRIVDSSLYRITFLSYDQLNYLWTGLAVVITPS